TDGLSWAAKKNQIASSTQKIQSVYDIIDPPVYELAQYLFYFYYHLDSKNKISKAYKHAAFGMMLEVYLRNIDFTLYEMKKFLNYKFLFYRLKDIAKKLINHILLQHQNTL
ncbi:hypothetical protein ACFLTD_05390, partial [Elusimicrobiota bacterium]